MISAVAQLCLRDRGVWRFVRDVPILAAIGTGIAVSNSMAVWQALCGRRTDFVRTPKQGDRGVGSYTAPGARGTIEWAFAAWAAVGALVGAEGSRPWIGLLLMVYGSGFAWVHGERRGASHGGVGHADRGPREVTADRRDFGPRSPASPWRARLPRPGREVADAREQERSDGGHAQPSGGWPPVRAAGETTAVCFRSLKLTPLRGCQRKSRRREPNRGSRAFPFQAPSAPKGPRVAGRVWRASIHFSRRTACPALWASQS